MGGDARTLGIGGRAPRHYGHAFREDSRRFWPYRSSSSSGALLGASTGIVGATVVDHGAVWLFPPCSGAGYHKEIAHRHGICFRNSRAKLFPPSIVLVLIGGYRRCFRSEICSWALFLPGLLLVSLFIIYILLAAFIRPESAPAIPKEETGGLHRSGAAENASVVPWFLPCFLIVAVLGSIFAGIASPTEAAGCRGGRRNPIDHSLTKKFNYEILKAVHAQHRFA